MKLITASLIASMLTFTSAVWADDAHHPEKAAAPAAQPLSPGEIKKVDKDAGKLTIKHGQLVNLDMPPMTMVFRVKEPTMLDQVKVGEKINFLAEKIGGALTVTQMEVVK